jgi:hypothetical protein
MQLNVDGELRLRDVLMRRGFIELRRATAVAAYLQIAEANVDAVGIDLRAGVADCGNQPAPVGISAGPGSLHQRRVRDSLGNLQRVRI